MSLYVSASGRPVNAHSYSGGSEFKFCRRKYKLHRLDGWQEKAKKAAPEFGKAIESAIQYFYDNGQKKEGCVDEFKRLWAKFQEIEMVYTDSDGDWASVYSTGSELTALFEVLAPTLPIRNPKFQLEYRKEVFPGSGLEFVSYIDLLSTLEDGSRRVVDIKTAKLGLSLDQNMLSLDPQLRRYAWVTGIRDVAFLWLVKAKTDSFKKGDTVTLLVDTVDWKAGQCLVIAKYDAEAHAQFLLGTPEVVRKMDDEMKTVSGKGATVLKDQIVTRYITEGPLCAVTRDCVTKTKIQWITATIPESELAEIGDGIGHEIVSIMDTNEKNRWLKDGGVRFPDNKCLWCSYRGICTGNAGLRDELLVQIGPKAPEKDWLEELEEVE